VTRQAERIVEAPRRAVREASAASTYMAMVRPSLDPSRYASKRRKPAATSVPSAQKSEPDPEPRPGFTTDELAPIPDPAEPLVPVSEGPVLNRDGEPILTSEAELRPAVSTPKLEIERPPAPKPKVELAELVPAKIAKPKRKTETAKKVAAKPKPEPIKAKEAAKKKEPASPYFVQLASGANADRMGIEYKRIKAKKPSLFAGRTARVTNGKDLFRLVIGPFKSRDESGAFVNQLAKAGIDGFSYTAPDGMTFEKIATQ
jgi:cell division protein FtsN